MLRCSRYKVSNSFSHPPPPLPISPSGFSDTGACFVHVFGVMAGSRRCVNGGGRGMRYSF